MKRKEKKGEEGQRWTKLDPRKTNRQRPRKKKIKRKEGRIQRLNPKKEKKKGSNVLD